MMKYAIVENDGKLTTERIVARAVRLGFVTYKEIPAAWKKTNKAPIKVSNFVIEEVKHNITQKMGYLVAKEENDSKR